MMIISVCQSISLWNSRRGRDESVLFNDIGTVSRTFEKAIGHIIDSITVAHDHFYTLCISYDGAGTVVLGGICSQCLDF